MALALSQQAHAKGACLEWRPMEKLITFTMTCLTFHTNSLLHGYLLLNNYEHLHKWLTICTFRSYKRRVLAHLWPRPKKSGLFLGVVQNLPELSFYNYFLDKILKLWITFKFLGMAWPGPRISPIHTLKNVFQSMFLEWKKFFSKNTNVRGSGKLKEKNVFQSMFLESNFNQRGSNWRFQRVVNLEINRAN